MENRIKNGRWKPVLVTTFIAGTLDIGAAFLNAWLSNAVTPQQVLAYIASGIWGKAAYTAGPEIVVFGLLFHFMIVFACVICFFWAYPKWSLLRQSTVLSVILIALTAWLVTTQLVVPFSRINAPEFELKNALRSVAILIVCVGIPITYAAKWQHKVDQKDS